MEKFTSETKTNPESFSEAVARENDNKLQEIEERITEIRDLLKPSRWQMFKQGLWRAVGYLIGLVLAVAILGWVLNIIGLVPALKDFSQNMKDIFEATRTR